MTEKANFDTRMYLDLFDFLFRLRKEYSPDTKIHSQKSVISSVLSMMHLAIRPLYLIKLYNNCGHGGIKSILRTISHGILVL